jgi:lanosterol synthase
MPHSRLFDLIGVILGQYESCAIPPLRRKALDRVYELLVMEDENTDCQDLGPVNKMMNQICRVHVEGRESEAFKRHMHRRSDFLWVSAKGMMARGTNGSQLWDIGFVIQAIVEGGLAEEEANRESCLKALQWLDQAQIRQNPKHFESNYRHETKGAWPFSTPRQGYVVSDCTGEGLKAAIYLQNHLE